jgi:hypothetical protein
MSLQVKYFIQINRPESIGAFYINTKNQKLMRKSWIFLVAIMTTVASLTSVAQDKPSSPKAEAAGSLGSAKVKIEYCQPSARGRKIMGGLVPYGEVWRTGANDATTIEFDKPVKVEGKDLPAGKYALFTIPGETEWTIIFNKDHKQWGAYSYKKEDDVLRVAVKPVKTSAPVETFKIDVAKEQIDIKWENTSVPVKIKG